MGLSLALLGGFGPLPLAAQEGEEPLLEELRGMVKSEAFSVGALFQFVGDFQADRSFPGQNGFSVANMRFRISGSLDRGFGYLFQTSFGSILDARMSWHVARGLTLDGGRFKTPFSAEFLTPASSIDFVNRSQAVSVLAPGRQVGVQARGDLGSEGGSSFGYALGVFNGNQGDVTGNDDDRFLYAGRVTWRIPMESPGGAGGALELGASASASGDATEVGVAEGGSFSFSGVDALFGGDVRLTRGPWLLSAELLVGDTDEAPVRPSPRPWGYHGTVGFMVTDNSQMLVRWDSFDADIPDLADDDPRLLVLGYNLWPTLATELQVNAVIPVDGPGDDPQLLVNAQVAF